MFAGVEIAGLAIALGLSAIAWMVATAHRRRVARAPSAATAGRIVAIRRAPHADRPGIVATGAEPGSWEAELVAELEAAGSSDARAAALDGAMAQLQGSLVAARGWSDAALRLAILGALLGATVAALAENVLAPLVALMSGALGAVITAAIARKTRAAEVVQRRVADELASALAGGPVGMTRGLDPRHRAR